MGKGTTLVLAFILAVFTAANAGNIHINSSILFIDGAAAPYNTVKPGDTVFIDAGTYDHLGIRGFSGQKDHPIVFINYGGKVIISGTYYYGISISGCSFFQFTGSGVDSIAYGFDLQKSDGGALGIGALATNYEIDHCKITSQKGPGILAKTDPDCSFSSTRDKFVCRNVSFHHNWIYHTDTEGIYFGSTSYDGFPLNCNGKDTTVLPHLTDGLELFDNLVEYSGWDGIQVGSTKNMRVYNNVVRYDSQKQVSYQMNGYSIGKGGTGLIYNNIAYRGSGTGMISFADGPATFFNNIVIEPGTNTIMPDGKYGFYIDTRTSTGPIKVINNLCSEPAAEGVKMVGYNNQPAVLDTVANNVVITDGASGTTSKFFKQAGDRAWIANNFHSYTWASTGYCNSDSLYFDICSESSFANVGIDFPEIDSFPDFCGKQRLVGPTVDAGPVESQSFETFFELTPKLSVVFGPNPVRDLLHLQLIEPNTRMEDLRIQIESVTGKLVYDRTLSFKSNEELLIAVESWDAGTYILKAEYNGLIKTIRLIKL